MTDGTGQTDLDRVLELVTAAHCGAREAIAELRDLCHGIHPAVLDQGLGAALTTLASGSELPVEVTTDLPERPSAAIEAIAYFCAELLTNVTKHSGLAGRIRAVDGRLQLSSPPGGPSVVTVELPSHA